MSARARQFLLGALCAATVTALTMEMLSAHADHRSTCLVGVDREATLQQLADLDGQLGDVASMSGRNRKVLRRLATMHEQISRLAQDIAGAPEASPGRGHHRYDHDDGAYDDSANQPGFGTGGNGSYANRTMTDAEFKTFLASVANATYASDQLALVKDQASRAWFTAAQVAAVVDQLAYSSDKVEAAAALWPTIVDPQNAYQIYDHLPYSSDRDALRQRVGAGQ
jgi:hypothetical protein